MPLQKRFLPYSFHPTLYVLILTNLTNPLPERMGLKSRGGGGWMGEKKNKEENHTTTLQENKTTTPEGVGEKIDKKTG